MFPSRNPLAVLSLKCLDTPLNFSSLTSATFKVLRRSNYPSVENHFSFTKPDLFLNETQMSGTEDSSLFSVPSYFIFPNFHCIAGSCVYKLNYLICSHIHAFESFEISSIWLRLQSKSQAEFICAV